MQKVQEVSTRVLVTKLVIGPLDFRLINTDKILESTE